MTVKIHFMKQNFTRRYLYAVNKNCTKMKPLFVQYDKAIGTLNMYFMH
jgi:hypothetical protein